MKGKEAYRFYQQNNVTTQNIEQILTTAYSLLKTEMEKNAPDAEHVIHALNTKYGKGCALFHSPELKRQIHHTLNTKWIDYDTEIITNMRANESSEYDLDDTVSEMYYYVSEMEDYYD